MERQDQALLKLGRCLRSAGFSFVTPTPLTIERVTARPMVHAPTLRDIFGWNRAFSPGDLPVEPRACLEAAGEITADGEGFRSTVRFSTIGELLFVHSGFPTTAADAVFFGPDTYRFVRMLQQELRSRPNGFRGARVVDIGAGSGAGGLCAASMMADARVILTDINARALRYCRINSALNGIPAEVRASDVLAAVPEGADLIMANPPYLVDRLARLYRHGGGDWGGDLSLRILSESLAALRPGGALLLYTGTPVVAGEDQFQRQAQEVLRGWTGTYRYEEIDPDVFGEELIHYPYDAAERLAAVSLIADRAAAVTG